MARSNASNAKRMLQSEINRERVLKCCKDWKSASQMAKELNCCDFVVFKAIKALKEFNCLDFKKDPGTRQSMHYKANGTPYVKRTYEELLEICTNTNYSARTPDIGKDSYRIGRTLVQEKFFNPWEPKIPEGNAVHEYRLWDKKDNHRHALRKREVSIGSSFSVFDSY